MYYPNKRMLHERHFEGQIAAAEVHAKLGHSVELRAHALYMANVHAAALCRLDMQEMSERAAHPAVELEHA